MPDYIFPSSVDLQMIAQELVPRLEAQREIFKIIPTRELDSHLVEWEQKDIYTGLQQVRGLNGMPSRVKPVSGKRFLMNPGTYGEFIMIDERQLTIRRQWGSFTAGINVTDSADLYGRRTQGLQTVNSIDQANALLAADDLPMLVAYDDGYVDDTSTFQLFIPNNKVIVVGARRDGDPLGNYIFTRNANN